MYETCPKRKVQTFIYLTCFITMQIKPSTYVISTTMLLFHVVTIKINALVPSVLELMNTVLKECGISLHANVLEKGVYPSILPSAVSKIVG